MKTKKTTKKPNDIEENIETVAIISEFESENKSLKAVLKMNKLTSLYEIDFYKNDEYVMSESYAYHTRRYHEDAAENYVNGIKKI